MTKYINGGLELKPSFMISSSGKDEAKKEPGLISSNFEPVLSMLFDPLSELGLITASSLKGFIFKLDVQPGTSSYTEYNLREKKQVEVTNFALKVVVISETDTHIGNFGKDIKESDSAKSFIEEATVQQDIWKRTYLKQGGEIAPSVGNLTFLKGTGDIITFLQGLVTTSKSDAVKNVLEFLISVYRNNVKNKDKYNLGILLMKNYKDSRPFDDYYNQYKEMIDGRRGFSCRIKENYLNVRQNILIKVLRLALLGYIHLDLHNGNTLISPNFSCVIIDYGKAVSIKDASGNYTPDKYIKYLGDHLNPISTIETVQTRIAALIKHSNDHKQRNRYAKWPNMDINNVLTELFKQLEVLQNYLTKGFEGFIESDKIKLFGIIIYLIAAVDTYTTLFVYDKHSTQMAGLLENYPYGIKYYAFSDDDLYSGDFSARLFNEFQGITDEEKIESNIPKIPSTIEDATIDATSIIERRTKRRRESEEEEVAKKKPKPALAAIKEEEEEEEEGLKVKTGGGGGDKKTIKNKKKAKRMANGVSTLKFKTKKRRSTVKRYRAKK